MTGRLVSAAVAAVVAVGCSPVASADCGVEAAGPSTVDGVFAAIPGFTVTPGCQAIASPFAGAEMAAVDAAEIGRDGVPVLTVFAGQLATGTGQAFLHDSFLAAVDGTASDAQTLGGYPVTYFNIPRFTDGYAYADGAGVVIAYDTAPPQSHESVREVLPTLLGRLRPG